MKEKMTSGLSQSTAEGGTLKDAKRGGMILQYVRDKWSLG